MGESYESKLDKDSIVEILGANRFSKDKYQNNDVAGVVTGLAWTSVGGSILFIESSLSPGKGKLTLTGNLGKVMKESASLALEFIKSNYDKFELSPEVFNKWDVHIHYLRELFLKMDLQQDYNADIFGVFVSSEKSKRVWQ